MDVADRAWLAGFIDGEGYVGMHRTGNGHANTIQSVVSIRHTHKITVDHVVDLLAELSVVPGRLFLESRPGPAHKDSWLLTVNRMAAIVSIGECVRPYVVTKTFQWDTLLEFCQSRLARAKGDRLYKSRELVLIDMALNMNRRGKPLTP